MKQKFYLNNKNFIIISFYIILIYQVVYYLILHKILNQLTNLLA